MGSVNIPDNIITYENVFDDLNNLSNNYLFNFEGEKIIPMDNRIKLIILDSLYGIGHKLSPYNILTTTKNEISENICDNLDKQIAKKFVFVNRSPNESGKSIISYARNLDENTAMCVQQTNRNPLRRNYLLSTEELGTLVSMLYFREKGYIVQGSLKSYGRSGDNIPGVDDVVVWKSPILDSLRKYDFIDKGCHISELACLRWLGKLSKTGESANIDKITPKSFQIIEVKSSRKKAIPRTSESYGMYQLLRAKKEKVASKLFICFPSVNEDINEIYADVKKFDDFGCILFDNQGIHIKDSKSFDHERMDSEIEEYENNLKKYLLNNFYYGELLEIINEFVYANGKGLDEVLNEFYNYKISEMAADYILQKLDSKM
ncbi:MAG: hypothetical protein ACOCQD_02945 [archaeon]